MNPSIIVDFGYGLVFIKKRFTFHHCIYASLIINEHKMSSFVLNASHVLLMSDLSCISKKPHCPKEWYSALKRIFIHLLSTLRIFPTLCWQKNFNCWKNSKFQKKITIFYANFSRISCPVSVTISIII